MIGETSELTDRVSQTASTLDELLDIMAMTAKTIRHRSTFTAVHPDIPATSKYEKNDGRPVEANVEELASDLVQKAKQLEFLIDNLPEPDLNKDYASLLKGHDEELKAVNVEYTKAMETATALHARIQRTIEESLNARHEMEMNRP